MSEGKPAASKNVESKHEKFVRIATARTNNVIKALSVLEHCSEHRYEYSQKDVEKIFRAILAEVRKTRKSFQKTKATKKPKKKVYLGLRI